MNRMFMRGIAGIALGIGSLVAWGEASALTCSQVHLMDASGVIGPKQKYTAEAQCEEEHTGIINQKLTWTGYQHTTVNNDVGISVIGSASWDRATGVAKESLKVTGNATGKRHTTAICSQDPFLRDPPGGKASCHSFDSQYAGEAGPAYQFFLEKAFFLARTISFVEAEALSKQKPQSAPPPPPAPSGGNHPRPTELHPQSGAPVARGLSLPEPPAAPKPKPVPKMMTSPSGARFWEGESLLASTQLPLHGGQVGPQRMGGFGREWSGGSQLLWTGGGIGAVLDLRVPVQAAGSYKVSLALTQGPDYGIFDLEVNGTKSPTTFDGYSKSVRRESVDFGTFYLPAGTRALALMVIGKNSQSTGMLVGIDSVTLTPAQRP